MWSNVSIFLISERFLAPLGIQYLVGIASKKNAPCEVIAGGVI
jgi:hypothetical protein